MAKETKGDDLTEYGKKCARVENRNRIQAQIDNWRYNNVPPSEAAIALLQIEAIVNLAQTIEAGNGEA